MEPKFPKMEPFQILLKIGTWANLRVENPNMIFVFLRNENFERSEGVKSGQKLVKLAQNLQNLTLTGENERSEG